MAAGGVYGYSQTAGSNTTIAGVSVAEGWPAENVNNSIRGMAADIAKYRDDTGGALTLAGGTTAYTLTTNSTVALTDGFRIHAVVNATNTGAATLAVDGLTAKAIRRLDDAVGDIALTGGELPKNAHAVFQYDASANSAAGAWIWVNAPRRPPKGHIFGLTLSNNGSDAVNDIDIAAGIATDSTGTVSMVLSSSITKRIDASWAVGTNQGGLDGTESVAGTPDTSTWYHVYLIMRADTGVVDAIFSESASAPTLPTNYTHYRRIGSVYNNSGGDIRAFTQIGDEFKWTTPVADVSVTNQGTSSVSRTLSVPPSTWALYRAAAGNTAGVASIYFRALTETDQASSGASGLASLLWAGSAYDAGEFRTRVDTSSQIGGRSSSANTELYITTYGWLDRRGADA